MGSRRRLFAVIMGEGVATTDQKASFKHEFTGMREDVIDKFYDMGKKTIGEGAFGKVVIGKDRQTQVERAIKAISIHEVTDHQRFQKEINIQKKLDHPSIVKLYEMFRDSRKYYL